MRTVTSGILDHLDQVPFVLFAHAAGVGRLEPAQQVPFAVRLVRQRRRIKRPLEIGQRTLVEIEIIEPADLVRAVVRAIPRADAAVVRHHVQAFLVVNGGVDRADVFARGGLAMLAEHRLVHRLHVVNPFGKLLLVVLLEGVRRLFLRRVGGVIAVDAHPVHFAAALHLVLADNGNVVLALAGEDARAAADARAQIHRHAPLMQRGLLRLVERVGIQRRHDGRLGAVHLVRKIRVLWKIPARFASRTAGRPSMDQ